MISVQININDKKVYDMSKRVAAPAVNPALLRTLKDESRDALTWEDYAKMVGDLMHDRKDRPEWDGVVLYEQELKNKAGETYEPGHKVHGYDNDGGDKLLKAEVEFLSPLLVYLFEKYKISPGQTKNVKFQVIYLGASSGVTESTQKGQILQHVEKLMTMFPKELIDFWWFVDPRPMTFSGRHRNYKHLQCLFSYKEMKDFNAAQKDAKKRGDTIRYIVISDIRTPINYDMTNAPRAVMRDVLAAYYLCENDTKQRLLTLLGDVAKDAKEKAELVEKIIKHDQKYQRIVRNTVNLDAMSTKFRAPYFYPYDLKNLMYILDDLVRFVELNTAPNSTELREIYIVKDEVDIGGGGGTDVSKSVLTKDFNEPESENLLWSAESDKTDEADGDEEMQVDGKDDNADEATDVSVNLQDFDNKLAAYNHDRGDNEKKLQKYIKSLYETCYQKCTGSAPVEEQLECLVGAYHGSRAHGLSLTDEDLANQLFWEWFKDKGSRKETFLKSDKCVEIQRSVEMLKSLKGGGFRVTDDMSSLVASLLVKKDTAVMDKLIQEYAKDVHLRQGYMRNYSNFGCNAKCPLFIERPDILMHLRLLLLIRHDKSIVGDWLDQYMVTENKEKYAVLVQRLLSVYDRKSNDSLSIKHKFSFEEEEETLQKLAKAALKNCKIENALQYMLGYVDPGSAIPDKFLNTRHWAIVFYNSCVRRIVDMELAFEYPFTDSSISQNEKTLDVLRNFFRPYLQKGQKDGCYYLGSNPAWNTARWPSGNPILHCAAQNGCTALVYLILTEYLPRGSELINFQRKKKGYTPLHLAVYFKKKEVEKVRRKRLKEVEELMLAWGAREDIKCTEKGGKKDETVLILREERDGSLPKLSKSTEESRNAARKMQDNKPDKFKGEKDEYPEANGPASGNRRRTYAPEVNKKTEDTDNTDSDGGEWEKAKSKTTVKSKPTSKKTGTERFGGGKYPYSPRNSTKSSKTSTTKANLSDLLEELEKNM